MRVTFLKAFHERFRDGIGFKFAYIDNDDVNKLKYLIIYSTEIKLEVSLNLSEDELITYSKRLFSNLIETLIKNWKKNNQLPLDNSIFAIRAISNTETHYYKFELAFE